ncbi:MAG: dihydroorotate dehydrogenase [Candidatus Heimdallarchaeota archaeon]|nr:MAG: dihydroorotate dehydrogenase [Candidatus Heimdallarchaeota archaeon]
MMMKELKTTIGNVEIKNPLILASGILGSTYSTLNRSFHEGFGAVTTKSIGIEPREGHPNPSVLYLPEIHSVINAIGLANPGCSKFSKELQNIESDVSLIVSVFGSSPDEFISVIDCLRKVRMRTSPVAFELNLSCPHAKRFGMAVGTDPEVVEEIVKEVKTTFNIPIWVKLTPNISDITKIGEAALSGGADALVAINTIKALLIDIEAKKPILGNIRGGLSGRAIKPIGLRAIYDLFESIGPKIPLIGLGGISKWEDVVEYLLAGASAVQIGSAFHNYSSPKVLITELLNGLDSYLVREDLTIEELKGMAHG